LENFGVPSKAASTLGFQGVDAGVRVERLNVSAVGCAALRRRQNPRTKGQYRGNGVLKSKPEMPTLESSGRPEVGDKTTKVRSYQNSIRMNLARTEPALVSLN
jgi:hypothetical protein